MTLDELKGLKAGDIVVGSKANGYNPDAFMVLEVTTITYHSDDTDDGGMRCLLLREDSSQILLTVWTDIFDLMVAT